MTREKEAELIAKVLAGDADSFEPLVHEHQSQIYNLALRMTGNPDDAFDISQDAFVKAYISLKDFRMESSFGSWLYRLASNQCLDFLRKRKRQKVVSLTMEDEDDNVREIDLTDTRFAPESELERAELRESLKAGLEALPPEQKRIIVMRDISGLSYQEMSEQLGVGLGTVKSRIFRAREKLASFLTDSGTNSPRGASYGRRGG